MTMTSTAAPKPGVPEVPRALVEFLKAAIPHPHVPIVPGEGPRIDKDALLYQAGRRSVVDLLEQHCLKQESASVHR